MRAFRDAFIDDLGVAIEEVVVGTGPCGELRYPLLRGGQRLALPRGARPAVALMTSRTLGTYSDFAAASLRADCVVYAHQVPCFHVFSPCRWLSIWQIERCTLRLYDAGCHSTWAIASNSAMG